MRWMGVVGVGLVSVGAVWGCSSGDGSGGAGSCPQVAGTWALSGSCIDSSCNVSQNGCSVTVVCSPSGDAYQGTVSGGSLTFSSSDTNCTASLSGTSASGSCTSSAGTCQFTAMCTSGACSSPGSGGATGSGGAPSTNCNTTCTQLIACCPGLPMSECLTGCSSTTPSPACISCFSDTSCGSLAPCAVAQCGLPQSYCGGS